MKIYIIGSGGVGGYFGGLLAKAGNNVTFLARNEHYNTIKSKGLKIRNVIKNFSIKPVKVINSISKITDPDFIFFSVKTYDTESVAKQLSKVVTSKTIIITFQNGIENDKIIKKYVKKARVFPGLAYVISAKTEPGIIRQTGGLRKLIFGDRKKTSNEKLKDIERIFTKSNIDAILSDDITRDLWKKYIFINAFSGMTAITRSSIGDILKDTFTKTLYKQCLQESLEVAKRLKVSLPKTLLSEIMKITEDTNEEAKSSLLLDIENERQNEIETLNGTLVKLARKYHVDVPINALIYSAIKLATEDTHPK